MSDQATSSVAEPMTADQPQVPGSPAPSTSGESKVLGLLGEFAGPSELMAAANGIREQGYRRIEAYSPFPVHGIDQALGAKRPILPWFVLVAGLTGCAVALLMQWYMNSVEGGWAFSGYAFNISGKPLFSLPANIPVTFELIILFSAFTAFLGMLAFNQLPKFANPLFQNERFLKATNDGFFLLVEASDAQFSEDKAAAVLESLGSTHVEPLYAQADSPIPRFLITGAAVTAVVALLPLAYIAYARGGTSETPRLSIWWDMDYQPKFKAQTEAPKSLFADGRAMRLPVAGTVSRGGLALDSRLHNGIMPGGEVTAAQLAAVPEGEEAPEPDWVTEFPSQLELNTAMMDRGEQRFNIYCATCHGLAGDGDGLVAQRALELQLKGLAPTWRIPRSLHDEYVRDQPIGRLYDTITHGRGGMAGYGEQLSVEDRWAIVLYVEALQRTRHTPVDELTEQEQAALR